MLLDLDQLQTFTILFDRIIGGFNKSKASGAMSLDISKDVVRHACLLHKFKSYGIPVIWHHFVYSQQ